MIIALSSLFNKYQIVKHWLPVNQHIWSQMLIHYTSLSNEEKGAAVAIWLEATVIYVIYTAPIPRKVPRVMRKPVSDYMAWQVDRDMISRGFAMKNIPLKLAVNFDSVVSLF